MSAQLVFFFIGSLVGLSIYLMMLWSVIKDMTIETYPYKMFIHHLLICTVLTFLSGFLFHLFAYLIPNS